MAQTKGTLELLAQEIEKFTEPVRDKVEAGELLSLLEQLGLRFPESLAANPGIVANLNSFLAKIVNLIDSGKALATAITDENTEQVITLTLDMVGQLASIIESFDSLSTEIQNTATPFGSVLASDIANFTQELPGNLVEYSLLQYLEDNYEILQAILEFSGIVKREQMRLNSLDPNKPPYTNRKLQLNNISTLLNDPASLFESIYGWGGNNLDVDLFLQKLAHLLGLLNIPVNVLPANAQRPTKQLQVGIIKIIPKLNTNPHSLEIEFSAGISASSGITVPLGLDDWSLGADFSGQLENTATLSIQPPFNLEFQPVAGQSGLSTSLSFIGQKSDGTPFMLLGKAGGSRLETKSVVLKAGANIVLDTTSGVAQGGGFVEAQFNEGKLVIDFSSADGFLQEILGELNLEVDFGAIIGVDSANGFYFVGSSQLEIKLPIHLDLSILSINGLSIQISPSGDGIPLGLGADLRFNLGPLVASVEGMGVTANFDFPSDSKGGNLGPLDFSIGFKPPNGIGLALDVGIVKGGGYLYLDFEREEYAGALELVFSEWIALKAIGLITTKMPDGSKGFSMVIIITAEFGSGIQLGFGFTLLGVGGILGINRVVSIDPLANSIRTGAVESVLFPQDVIANAPRIISDLRVFFPVQEGQFLIGPMAKIGFGTPTLASLSLGVIIEFPDVAITILGVLKVVLPDENAAVIKLQVNFIGRVEPANSLLWFYAELYDSRILFLTIEGGMGLLVNWGDDANFVFSVGGFHPKYDPPPLPFPSPPRIAINILNESVARIRIEGYFAVTSNSVQFGARAELYFGFSALNVEGYLGFDVLIQFNPFYFIFEFSAGLSVKVFGFGLFSISISGLLEGPSRWHIKGKAKWKITWLGPTIKINIDETWGEEKQTTLPPIAIFPLVEQEFATISNWQVIVPKNSNLMVTLRQLDAPEPGAAGEEPEPPPMVLHPVGKLRVSQRKIPLNFTVEKLGNQPAGDVNRLSVSARISGGSDLETPSIQDKFATGEYIKLDTSKKLSSPGFELYDSGVDIQTAGDQLRTSMAVKRVVRYETIIIDNNFKRRSIRFFATLATRFSGLTNRLFQHFIRGSSVTKSTLSASYRSKIQPNFEQVTLQPQGYSVANVRDNTLFDAGNGTVATFSSQAQAEDFLKQQCRDNPRLSAEVHVIPNPELIQFEAA